MKFEEAFTNVETRIKSWAVINFVFGIVGSVICAFHFGLEKNYYHGSTRWETTVLFWVILILVPIISYVESLIIYGFGELIENSRRCKESLYQIEENSFNVISPTNENGESNKDNFDDPALHF